MKITLFGIEVLSIEKTQSACTSERQQPPVVVNVVQPQAVQFEEQPFDEKEYLKIVDSISGEVGIEKSVVELILRKYDEFFLE